MEFQVHCARNGKIFLLNDFGVMRMQLGQDVKTRLVSIIDKAARADNSKRLEASVLGINYKAVAAGGDVEVRVEDPLNREEDSSRLLVYLLNAIERAFEGKLSSHKGDLTSLTQLPGGQTAKLYEKR
ncbi:MAG: hypothetical protein QXK98_07290, partial [Candidatus Bathyarchaeia archaeon]